MKLPTDVSISTKRRNPELYGLGKLNPVPTEMKPVSEPVREALNEVVRESDLASYLESADPLCDLNKTEREFYGMLIRRHTAVLPHGLKLKLATKTFYTPDFICFGQGLGVTIYEVKGGHIWDDAMVKLKCAANRFSPFRFVLAQKKKGQWRETIVKP